jgi:restriction system protein
MAYKFYFQAEVSHNGLNKYRIVKATTRYELNQKVDALKAQWDEQWSRELQRKQKETERASKIRSVEGSIAYANEMTQKADSIQEELDSILLSALQPKDLVCHQLQDITKFPTEKPQRPQPISAPVMPHASDSKYNPKPPFIVKISKKKMIAFRDLNLKKYHEDLAAWEVKQAEVETKNKEISEQYDTQLKQWEIELTQFQQRQDENNAYIETVFQKYKIGDTASIEIYFTWVLERIYMPFDNFDKTIDIEYDGENKRIIIDMVFPTIENLPTLKEVSYIKSKNELKEINYPEPYLKKKYESVMYQIVLQTLSYIFTLGNKYSLFDSVVINGKINTVDKATGNSIEPYILSISITRSEFDCLNLSAVDPKTWFRSVKGVSAASLANVTPIAPIVAMNRNDSRFIEGYNVVDQINDSVNLAAIDWQDFENLIREIFEKVFNANGGEVKITQASRDGGVDAVAFDPDPIRGGKIVIQAKRYTNVVGVSAVRDLYGTVMNEGATKGILVTTSNYGNDAYSFAKGKPLTLMNGANLLFLLEQHGYKARIDIKEAKKLQEP